MSESHLFTQCGSLLTEHGPYANSGPRPSWASVFFDVFFFRQHLFIPVLPSFLLDYLTAPMPFVIGVHNKLMEVGHFGLLVGGFDTRVIFCHFLRKRQLL